MQWFIDKAIWIYYFNIIMISVIILAVLLIAYNRAKSVIINNGERSEPMSEAKKLPPTVKLVVIYGLIFFTVREYGHDFYDWLVNMFEWIGDKIG
jgi:hypothetical protein